MTDLPHEIQVWRSTDTLDHTGTWATTRFPAEAVTYVPKADAQAAVALAVERDGLRRNLRETFEAMCTMRDAINEHVPMPSLESDLLQGPENSVFCAAVAEAVIAAVEALRKERALAEQERVTEWNRRRDAEGSRNAAFAACDTMRAERDRLAAELAAAKQREAALVKHGTTILQAAKELAEYVSYAEIVGGLTVNRPQVREWCDNVFSALHALPEDENFERSFAALAEMQARDEGAELRAERDGWENNANTVLSRLTEVLSLLTETEAERDDLRARLAEAEGRVKALTETYWLLRSYAIHDDKCKLNKPPHFKGPCSCGLSEAIAGGVAALSPAGEGRCPS